MFTYRDLPALVTDNILAFASNGTDGNLTVWKRALPLLSVCHDWRVYGKYHLYRYAIVETADPRFVIYDFDEEGDYSDEEAATYLESLDCGSVDSSVAEALDNGTPVRIYTNITLIDELGLESMVKQLLFAEKRSYDIVVKWLDSLKTLIFIIRALFCGLPEEIKLTKPFIKWYELEYTGTEPIDPAEIRHHTAPKAVADVLINKYPNVSSINAAALEPHEFMQTLIVELAVGYDKQLTKYANDMPTPFPYTLTAPNLIVLDLTFSDSSDLIFPTICPRSLRKIYIELENQPFSWDMFRGGVEAEAIVFDNLVNLSISGMVQDPDADNAMANVLDMRFPKLERLVLTNSYLARNEADAMMAHGLKRFQHEGSIIAASQLCKQPFGNLDELYLCWEKRQYFDEADSFVPLTNEIFNKTKGIEYVQCEIRMQNFSRSMDGVDWPYLTHLSLGFTMTFKALFKMLPKVPNLVQLDMIIGGYDRNELTKTIRLLTNIKKHYPTPSLSKIKKLLLADERAALRRKSYFQPQFRKALENLKWYWPQLKDIGYFD